MLQQHDEHNYNINYFYNIYLCIWWFITSRLNSSTLTTGIFTASCWIQTL
jgi:hypothetical protein